MASADRKHLIAACVAAVDLRDTISPNARLWLARASLHADPKGRTGYGPARYAGDTGDTETSGQAAIAQLLACGLVINDHNDDGVECWRLAHYDWQRGDTIGGYSSDAGQKRDGLPPMYGRHVNDVIGPNGTPFTPPADTHWTHLVTQEQPT
jgi:hypothetical protein